jgi:predicted nucleic acid-binding Zn ribbon protein
MNKLRRCYYWLFQNETASRVQPHTHCPVCGLELTEFRGGHFTQRCCEPCSLLLSARRDG